MEGGADRAEVPMRASKIGFVLLVMLSPALLTIYGCGSSPPDTFTDDGGGTIGIPGSSSSSGGAPGTGTPGDDGGSSFIILADGAVMNTADSSVPKQPTQAIGIVQSPDCAGCTFPPIPGSATPTVMTTPPACASSAPAIELVYPTDGVLIPPNMGLISVQS